MEARTVHVPNISCNHCVMTIEREVGDMEGVAKVSADADTKNITVEGNHQQPGTQSKRCWRRSTTRRNKT